MLSAFKILILFFLVISLCSLLLGLLRPVYVLWFLDRFNRLKVIKVYGLAAFVLICVWILLNYLK